MPTGTRKIRFAWTDRTDWLWPVDDRELIRVVDYVDDLEVVLPLVNERRLVVQAGGACGIWPARLATEFGTVVTFEPEIQNFICLSANVADANVIKHRAALGAVSGRCHVQRDHVERGNAGAWYAIQGAEQTIARTLPIIMLEYKLLPHAPEPTSRAWLTANGYRHVGSVHRDDIWAPIKC